MGVVTDVPEIQCVGRLALQQFLFGRPIRFANVIGSRVGTAPLCNQIPLVMRTEIKHLWCNGITYGSSIHGYVWCSLSVVPIGEAGVHRFV